MKKRILSLILALSMVLSVLPLGAFAEGSTGELVIDESGYPVGSEGGSKYCSGNGNVWEYYDSSRILCLNGGAFDLSTTEPVECKISSAATITGGTFNGAVENIVETISGGIFNGTVTNASTGKISGGTFAGSVDNSGTVTGGVFNLNANPTGVTGGHNITWDAASSTNATITEVNGVAANWAPYAYAGTTVTITANTEIYSLNGYPIEGSPYNSSYGNNGLDKNTVKFTMPDKDVVLSTGELVMENGYPVGTSGKGWRYISGTLYLDEGTYNFSSTHPQNTGAGTRPVPAVRCMIEIRSGVEITGGSFGNSVTNYGTISSGTFQTMGGGVINEGTIKNGTFTDSVTNDNTISGGTFQNGCSVTNNKTISGGTFQNGCRVTNYGTINGNGTFEGTVVNNSSNATIENGTFEQEVINNAGGIISDGTFKGKVSNYNGRIANGTFMSDVANYNDGQILGGIFAAGLSKNDGSVTGGVFNGNRKLTDARHVTVTNGSLSQVNGVDPRNSNGMWDLYAYKGTTVTITASTDIFSLNGQPIGTGNCNSSYGSDYKTVKFTMPDDKDVVLNGAITSTDLVMENGYPKDSNGGTIPCKGDGWEYIKNDPTNGDMLLLTDGLFDFSIIGDGSAVECNVFVGKPTAITGGEFNGKVFNNSGILGGTFNGPVENRAPGRIENGTFHGAVENNGIIENGTFNDEVQNNGTINDGTFNGKVENDSAINSGTFNDEVVNTTMGRIEDGMFHDAVENNGTIENGTFHDAVENKGTINGGTFNGAVTSSGTVSGNITGSGTLNGESITKTPEPEPEPTTYTVTVIGGTIDGKTSVSAKENDTLTVVLDQSEVPDGMTFDLWSISSDKLSGDINVDYRAESMTFRMPPEDVTIRAQYRSAEIIEDTAPSPLATAATIAVGGAAAGIVVWQGVSLGVDLYLTSALPQGVPVPTDRRALALLLWETAGKPEVALPTLYGDVPAEEIELQKATRWAIQNGLMDAADKKDASLFDPDHYVTKMDVFGAWLRLKKLLSTT